jgi:hypothetical protein
MNLNFDHALLLDGERSYIASVAIVDPTNTIPVETHNRVERRRAAKTHRTPEIIRDGLLHLSPIAIPLPGSEHSLLIINASENTLQNWAKHSRIQTYTFAHGDEAIRQLEDVLPWDLLSEVNQKLQSSILQTSADTGMEIAVVLYWAHNSIGYRASHIRKKVYSF